ncbi:MAG: TIGR04283 family arsenosugar biosynthesis glycosyltransferase [Alphaproteobacteria bacterium]|jgi:rSAM/selenodomain-associated transferase 2|nr:TIGR04283 family arsenosugar biosynthesis glycosyltransferase [Alphaproteobacteria bacterium]MDP6567708.1 TIGR04283 family arsenosugar biosynthesis glycosyltransferase [Alphaproteobacteria bacterium]MDP6812710.1 TIGR04283 family arsenosugar biosynthesis glycosyltransferase [Alphaproteobacteria bacterium]
MPAMLSVVIPTLNAAAGLPACLEALAPGRQSGLIEEVVVSDGGSTDATRHIAEAAGASWLSGGPGRGGQLQRGAVAAGGEWLLFVHADTVLPPEWLFAVESFIAEAGNAGRAAAFRFALDDPAPAARRHEALVAWRCRRLGLPFGDQGLLLSRRLYGKAGGFRDLPLMEDVDLVRRIGRRRLDILPVAAVTSAERYRRGGYWCRPLRNLTCLGLYFLGLPPRLLVRLYG